MITFVLCCRCALVELPELFLFHRIIDGLPSAKWLKYFQSSNILIVGFRIRWISSGSHSFASICSHEWAKFQIFWMTIFQSYRFRILQGLGPGRRIYMALFLGAVLYSCFLCLFAVCLFIDQSSLPFTYVANLAIRWQVKDPLGMHGTEAEYHCRSSWPLRWLMSAVPVAQFFSEQVNFS